MGNNLGTQPDTRFQFQFRQLLKEFLNMVGGNSETAKETEIDKEVKMVENNEDKERMKNLMEMVSIDENSGGKGKKKSRNQQAKQVQKQQSEGKVQQAQKQPSATTRPTQNRTNTEHQPSKDDDYTR